MKKILKKLTLILAVVSVMLSLTSCSALDEMKEKQAFWNEGGTVITWQGNDYRAAADLKDIDWYGFGTYDHIYVTESDVPVLLSDFMGDMAYVHENGMVIFTWASSDYAVENEIFCYIREDVYDQVHEEIENSVMDHYCTTSSVVLDDELTEEIRSLIADRSLRVDEDEAYDHYDFWALEESVDIYACDEMMFRTHNMLNFNKLINEETEEEVVMVEYYGFDETTWYLMTDTTLFDKLYEIDEGETDELNLF